MPDTKRKIFESIQKTELEPLDIEEYAGTPESEATIGNTEEPKPEEGMAEKYKMQLQKNALIGAAPLLVGILTGNTVEGAQIAGDNLVKEDERETNRQKTALEAIKAGKKGELEKTLAQMRLEREQKRLEAAKAKAAADLEAPLEKKHIVEIEGEDGKPQISLVRDALQKAAWKKSAEDDFHLSEKMKLEEHKAGLKHKAKATDPYKAAANENELYRLYGKDSETTRKMGDAYTRFRGAMSRPQSSANDLAVIFNFMKILDPTSVVREGEQASAANATSVPDSVRTMYNRILLGKDQKLPTGLRDKFFNEASAMYDQQLKSQGEIDEFFKGVAGRRGLDSANIIRSFPKAEYVKEKSRSKEVSGIEYVNKDGEKLMIDPSLLTDRMKRDLKKDGFSPKGK